tara:strand:+ start:1455 stop:2783 length:1329 start_codon:yes stop_codon:yes gene_type:complete
MSSNHNIEVVPSNVTSNGTISYRNGNPVIQFIIGEQDRLLMGNSVRFTGKFVARLTSTSLSTSGTSPLRMSEKLGVYAAIDTLTIKSQRTGQTIESIRHYNRFLASYLPVTNSQEDAMTHMNETSLILPNWEAQRQSVVNIPSGSTTQNSFCMALPCGILNGRNPIPLMPEAVGGIIVEIHLAPDSQVFFSNTATSASISQSFYEFSDVSLVAELMDPSPEALQSIKSQQSGTFEYNSISSYYQTINSTNGILNFQLGLSRVLGVFSNLVPASHINNLVFDGLATMYPTNSDGSAAVIDELFFTRNGEKFPINYNIDTIQRENTDRSTVFHKDDKTMDSQIIFNYMNAIQKFGSLTRTQINQVNTRYSDDTTFDKYWADGGSGFGIGMAYDSISDQGVDFSRVNFGVNMSLRLNTDSPQAMFLYVHAKNTLVFGPQGMQVMA